MAIEPEISSSCVIFTLKPLGREYSQYNVTLGHFCVIAGDTSSQLKHTAKDWNGANVQFPVGQDGFISNDEAVAAASCAPRKSPE